MSMSMRPSSSLRTLERHNYSKSTVSSSDTEADSAGYASSSGTTTPEDDAQTFHLDQTLQSVLTDGLPNQRPSMAVRVKPTIVTRHRHFSLAVQRVKRVVHALGVFKKKRPDDISPILISSPLRERFGKRMSVKPHPDEGFYSLPNRRFSLSDVNTLSHRSPAITRKFGTISGSTPGFAQDTIRKEPPRQRGLRMPMPSFSATATAATAVVPRTDERERDVLRFRTILGYVLRVLLFVPWCVAVGGALLLFPHDVERIAFRAGYLSPRRGIRRFAYWAECGQQHVVIFLGGLVAVLWASPALGLSLTGIVVSRAVCVWWGFEVDRGVPLGEDDQQSLYLVVAGLDRSFAGID